MRTGRISTFPFPHFHFLIAISSFPIPLFSPTKGLSTREAGRGHATPHMPVETAKCWWLLKIEPNAWAGGKGSCAVCVDLQAVGALEFFGELCSLAEGFGPIFEGVWAGFREREGSIFSNHQHFAVSTGIQRIYAAFEFQVLPWMIPLAGWCKLASRCLHSHLPLA